MEKRLLLRANEAAEQLGISRSLLYQLIGRGEIRPIKIGRAVRVSARELEDWVRRQEGRDDSTDKAVDYVR